MRPNMNVQNGMVSSLQSDTAGRMRVAAPPMPVAQPVQPMQAMQPPVSVMQQPMQQAHSQAYDAVMDYEDEEEFTLLDEPIDSAEQMGDTSPITDGHRGHNLPVPEPEAQPVRVEKLALAVPADELRSELAELFAGRIPTRAEYPSAMSS